ncbi:MAG TPA: VanW family protein [Myxococcales bacterium]
MPEWLLERGAVAHERVQQEESRRAFGFVLAAHQSPLRRAGTCDERLQRGKEQNVGAAIRRIDGLCLRPSQVFSYHHAVGRPSRLRGFTVGSELRDGALAEGVGGGCCLVANLLYWLGLNAGLRVVERHRHGFDLFPDQDRRVPFGGGATVFYNYADLRLENPLPQPVLLRLWIEDAALRAEARCERDPGFRVEVYETEHRWLREGARWIRENRIRRRIVGTDGAVWTEHEVSHNRGVVLYDPPCQEAR